MDNSNQDWAYLEKFQLENEALNQQLDENRIVFIGDSIIAGWYEQTLFEENKNFINRGINGQTTSQILHRFQQDVIDLKPKSVIILVGTNDIAENQGPIILLEIQDNFQKMIEQARINNIKIVLCSILPVSKYYWNTLIEPLEKIKSLNTFLVSLADKKSVFYVEFYTNMEKNGGFNQKFSEDGVHPNLDGYTIMSDLLLKSNYLK